MPNTIQDKLTYLNDTKDAIKQSIIGKGVEVTDTDTFRSYADKITSIQTGGGGGTGSLFTGTKLAYSTFSTIPDEYISYLEQQTDLSYMFYNCQKLTTIPLFNIKYAFLSVNMFYGCSSLTNLEGFRDLKMSLNLSYSPLLTVDSVVNVINNAKDMTSSSRTLTLHQEVFNKLSQEQISTATAKGWNIAAK